MALKPLVPPIKEPLQPGWDILATEAGRTGRGLRVTLVALNGDAKACHSIALGHEPDQARYVHALQELCGAEEATVRALLPKLAYLIEGVLRQMATAHAGGADLPGQPLTFDALEPWDAPVDGAALLTELAATYQRYVVLPAGGAEALALWTLHTYALAAADVSPYIVLSSAQPRSGKSTTLSVASALAYRPLLASNITPAVLFRTVEAAEPTLLIDEADTFARDNDELRGVLNSGHTRRTAYVVRTVGDTHEPRRFSTWAPKIIAGIGRMPDTIRDRAIVLQMVRRRQDEPVTRWRERYVDALVDVRRRCLRWAQDTQDVLAAADPDVPAWLHDRAADNWTPLLAIAEAAGGDWPARTRRAMQALDGSGQGDKESATITLLQDLRSIFAEDGRPAIPTADILQALHGMEERPWPEWGRQRRPMSPRQLATLLEPFSIRPKTIRIDSHASSNPKGYRREDCTDAFSRYLPSQSATPQHASNDADSRDFSSATTDADVADVQTRKSAPDNRCCGVADQQGLSRGDAKLHTHSNEEELF